jgi:hypothetical protein
MLLAQVKDVIVTKYPHEQAKYQAVVDAESNAPFSVDKGLVLSNCKVCASYFGPDGYAVDISGVENGGPLYS